MGALLCCVTVRQPSPGYDDGLKMSNSTQYVSPAETPFTDDDDKQQRAKYENLPEKIHDLETLEDKKYRMIGRMTLEDCLLASPNVNPLRNHHIRGEIQIFKHLSSKLCPPASASASASPREIEGNHEFLTPRMDFSPADRLGVIEDEMYEYDVVRNLSTKSIMNRNPSRKLGKKVTFRMPEEADIYLYYTPNETFEDE